MAEGERINSVSSNYTYGSVNCYAQLGQGHKNVDLLICQILVNRVRPNVVGVQRVNDLLVGEHSRVRLLRRLDLPHQELAYPSLADVSPFR